MYFYACMGIKDGMGRNGSNSNINVRVCGDEEWDGWCDDDGLI